MSVYAYVCVCLLIRMNSFLSVLERDILQHLLNAVVDLITADQCLIFNGQPSASLRRKRLNL